MEIEQQIRNTIIQGVLTYDENIFVVEDLDGNLQPDLDCYVRVDVSLSEATGVMRIVFWIKDSLL